MKKTLNLCARASRACSLPANLIEIRNATFYRDYPSASVTSPPLFPGLTFTLSAPSTTGTKHQFWAIIGPSSAGKTTLLDILRGGLICLPPNARTYPCLAHGEPGEKRSTSSRNPWQAILYVGFGDANDRLTGPSVKGAYLSARYESRREATDFSLYDYLRGTMSLNPTEDELHAAQDAALKARVIETAQLLELEDRLALPIGNLSNGQTRRARIAKALMQQPRALLLDEPFLGLDPRVRRNVSRLLQLLSVDSGIGIVISLQPQDRIPSWVSHILYLGTNLSVQFQGVREEVLPKLANAAQHDGDRGLSAPKTPNSHQEALTNHSPTADRENLIQMQGVQVRYGEQTVIGDWSASDDNVSRRGLQWTVTRGERWGLFGPNGSGKTTLLAMISSDHPQSYSQPIQLFGRSRLPMPEQPALSIFELQARIGQSSPEIHNFFPRNMSVRRTLESAWADTFLSKPALTPGAAARVDACLRWFQVELLPDVARYERRATADAKPHSPEQPDTALAWADDVRFRDLSLAAQKVALLVRALIKKPDLVILDEAFSGMDAATRRRCMAFLTHGIPGVEGPGGLEARQALVCVSHRVEEVPALVSRWICLPEPGSGEAPRFGHLSEPRSESGTGWWDEIWGL